MSSPSRAFMTAVLALACAACDLLPSDAGRGTFTVTVQEPAGTPVAGARIRGGIDWDAFDVVTDSTGQARMPGRARHVAAEIRAINHFAVIVTALEPGRYPMQPTPGRIEPVGYFAGSLISASPTELSTIDVDGRLRRYAIADGAVVRTFEVRTDSGGFINNARVERDTLWLANGNGLLAAFSMADRDQPRRLFGLPVLTFDWATLDSVRIGGLTTTTVFTYSPTGELRTLAVLSLPTMRHAWRLDGTHALLEAWAYVGDPVSIVVVDAANPRQPRIAYRQDIAGAGTLAFAGTTLFVAHPGRPGEPVVHDRIDLSDPDHPRPLPPVTSSVETYAFLSDSIAVGRLRQGEADYGELAFVRRNGSAFETLSTAGGLTFADGHQVVQYAPLAILGGGYFGGTVWRLGWQDAAAAVAGATKGRSGSTR